MDDDRIRKLASDPAVRASFAAGQAAVAFGELVGALMRANGVTQAELARRLGVDHVTLRRRLSGDVDPRLSSMAEILRALECPLDRVFSGIAAVTAPKDP